MQKQNIFTQIVLIWIVIVLVPGLGCTNQVTDPNSDPPTELTNVGAFPVVDTNQINCYDDNGNIIIPGAGEPFYGQDAQHEGNQPSYQDNGNDTVTDLTTGLMWQQGTDLEKSTFDDALAGAGTFALAGHTDWRLPTIKELYSLMDFTGETGMSAAESTPYIDTNYFVFEYGDESAGERFIDAQYCSSTMYIGTTMFGDETVFGVNFADGRIKGYGLEMPDGSVKKFYVRYVRESSEYGVNDFQDNGNGTVSDSATGLMWTWLLKAMTS